MALCGLALMISAVSCTAVKNWTAHGWAADYDSAEVQGRRRGAALLIYYSDPPPGQRDPLRELLKDTALRRRFREYVCCRLYKAYEPDRRYVAQYGVERAPAWIVVHPDGTYHARTGAPSKEDLLQFLADAAPPGERPALNPYIPREVRYAWHENLFSAQAAAEEEGKSIFVVYHRRMGRDWKKLSEMLHNYEVFSRMGEMVPCRIELWNPWMPTYITGFGVLKLPALVIAHRNGSYHILEQPTSNEAIVRFLDRHRRPDAPTTAGPVAATAEP